MTVILDNFEVEQEEKRMTKFFNFHDMMQASANQAFSEYKNSSLLEEGRKKIEECRINYEKEQAHYEYVFSPQRDEIFKKMEEKSVCLGMHCGLNVSVTYLENGFYDGQIILSGGILHLSDEDRTWREDLCWLITTAESCIIDSIEDLFFININFSIYDKVRKTDKTPEA